MKAPLHVTVDLCIIPIGTTLSISPYIAKCHELLKTHHLTVTLHAFGTNIEGDWDTVFLAIKQCHELCHKLGVIRLSSTIKCGTRIDKKQSLQDKIDSVNKKIKT